MSNPLSLGDHAHRLTANIPGLDPLEARRRINVAYVAEAIARPWPHLLKHFTLQTEPMYSIGTVTVTPSASSVPLAGGVWSTAWTTAPSMRRVVIQGRFEPYDVVTITQPGGVWTATLADPWIGGANAAATYAMWRDEYALPADCGYSSLMALYDPEQRFRLEFMNQTTFLRELHRNAQQINDPYCFTTVSQSAEAPPRARFRMYPAPPTTRAYHGFYFGRPDFMVADTDYPLWPIEFQDILWLSALLKHYETPRYYSPKFIALYKPQIAELYSRMVKAFDGNAAIDLVLEDISTAPRRRGSNANWSPNVMGWSGVELTRS